MAPLGLLARRLMATVKHVACLQVQSVTCLHSMQRWRLLSL